MVSDKEKKQRKVNRHKNRQTEIGRKNEKLMASDLEIKQRNIYQKGEMNRELAKWKNNFVIDRKLSEKDIKTKGLREYEQNGKRYQIQISNREKHTKKDREIEVELNGKKNSFRQRKFPYKDNNTKGQTASERE